MKTGSIKQKITFNASPKKIYSFIMDAKQHGLVAGGNVKMSPNVKGNFEVFDGYCYGYNIELEEGKKCSSLAL